MYLSRVEINPRLRACKLALNSPQRLHAMIAASFPSSSEPESDRRHLWRLDKLDNALYALVMSPIKPDFTHLIEQIGWPASGQSWETKDYDPFLDKIDNGQQWLFRLRANPTWSKPNEDNPSLRGRVIPCLRIDEQKSWLETRIAKHGVSLHGFELVSREVNQFSRNGKTVTLNIATFEGILSVVEPALLREALVCGLGRAKAYGCGLLTLAPVSK